MLKTTSEEGQRMPPLEILCEIRQKFAKFEEFRSQKKKIRKI